jgi:hypothetical protein
VCCCYGERRAVSGQAYFSLFSLGHLVFSPLVCLPQSTWCPVFLFLKMRFSEVYGVETQAVYRRGWALGGPVLLLWILYCTKGTQFSLSVLLCVWLPERFTTKSLVVWLGIHLYVIPVSINANKNEGANQTSPETWVPLGKQQKLKCNFYQNLPTTVSLAN